MLAQRVLHVHGVDVEAAGDHHVLEPVLEVEKPPLVDQAPVAGVQPAVHQGLGRLLGQAPVAGHQQVAARHHFAHFARGQQAAIGRHDGHVAEPGGAAHRGQVALVFKVLGAQHGEDLRRLGLAVGRAQHRAEEVAHLTDLLGRHGRAAVDEPAQARKVRARRAGQRHQHVDQRGRHEAHGAAALAEGRAHCLGARARQHHVAAALRQDGQDVCGGAVCDGCGHDVALVLVKAPGVDLVGDVGHPRAVGLHHALGRARGAAGELDGLGGVVRQVQLRAGCARVRGGQACQRGGALVGLRPGQHAGAGRAFEQVGARGIQHQQGGLGRVDDAADLGPRALGVERHPHLAAGQHGQQRGDVVGAVARADAHAALGRGVDSGEARRERGHAGGQRVVTDGALGRVDGNAVGPALGSPPEEVDREHGENRVSWVAFKRSANGGQSPAQRSWLGVPSQAVRAVRQDETTTPGGLFPPFTRRMRRTLSLLRATA